MVSGQEVEVLHANALGSRVFLTLASPVTDIQSVTVSYTPPAARPTEDIAGNDAAAFSNMPVENRSPDTTAPAAPTLTLASDTGSLNNDNLTNNGTVNVAGLESGASWEYSTDNGNNWSTGTGTSFTLAAGTYAVGAVQARQTDAAGNLGAAGSTTSAITVDTTAPAAIIDVADTALIAGETSNVTITFSEAVTGLEITDFSVANGALGSLGSADGGITWTATLTPTVNIEDSSNLITLADAAVTDAAGNPNSGATASNNYTIDSKRPTDVPPVFSSTSL